MGCFFNHFSTSAIERCCHPPCPAPHAPFERSLTLRHTYVSAHAFCSRTTGARRRPPRAARRRGGGRMFLEVQRGPTAVKVGPVARSVPGRVACDPAPRCPKLCCSVSRRIRPCVAARIRAVPETCKCSEPSLWSSSHVCAFRLGLLRLLRVFPAICRRGAAHGRKLADPDILGARLRG